jgi:hypothetical protein
MDRIGLCAEATGAVGMGISDIATAIRKGGVHQERLTVLNDIPEVLSLRPRIASST